MSIGPTQTYYVIENMFEGQLSAEGPYRQIPGRRFYTIQTHLPSPPRADGFLSSSGLTWSRLASVCQCPTEARQSVLDMGGNFPLEIDPLTCGDVPQSACHESTWHCSVKPTPMEALSVGSLLVSKVTQECGVVVETHFRDGIPTILVLFATGDVCDYSAAEAYYFTQNLFSRCAVAAEFVFEGVTKLSQRFAAGDYAGAFSQGLCRKLSSTGGAVPSPASH